MSLPWVLPSPNLRNRPLIVDVNLRKSMANIVEHYTKGAQGALWRAGAAGWAEVEMKLNDALAKSWSCGYTLGMKTAISIPNDLFDGAERLARRTRRSRSRLFTDALREYLARHAPDKVTESMDQAIMEIGEEKDELFPPWLAVG